MIRSRLVQHFAFHVGERGDVVVAGTGWGKSTAVRDWLEAAGDAADVIWLAVAENELPVRLWERLWDGFNGHGLLPARSGEVDYTSIADMFGRVRRPTFVVLDDFHNSGDPFVGEGVAELIDRIPAWVNFVVCSSTGPPTALVALIEDGVLRLTGPEVLAFDDAETVALYRHRYGIPPTRELVSRILRDTRGRPASVSSLVNPG